MLLSTLRTTVVDSSNETDFIDYIEDNGIDIFKSYDYLEFKCSLCNLKEEKETPYERHNKVCDEILKKVQTETKLVGLSNANMEDLVNSEKAYVQKYYTGMVIPYIVVTTPTVEYVIPCRDVVLLLTRVRNALGDMPYQTRQVYLRVTNPSEQT